MQITTAGFIVLGSTFISEIQPGNSPSVPTIFPLLPQENFVSTIHYRVTEDRATLAEVATRIYESNPNLTDFHPRMALIATWLIDPERISSQVISYQYLC